MDDTVRYEAWGPVRGSCGHKHRTIRGALRCVEADQKAIKKAYPSTYPTNAYSDRSVRRTDGEPLS
jgi:hypothetical protein